MYMSFEGRQFSSLSVPQFVPISKWHLGSATGLDQCIFCLFVDFKSLFGVFFFIPKKSQKKIQSNVRNGRTKPKYWYQEIPWRQKENKNITLKGLCQALCMILSFCMLTTVPACQPQKIITFVFDQKNMWEKSTSFVFQRIKKALSYILNVYNDFIEDTVM